jgi:coenzyme F420 biosynthesis associated uncharacterized protein
VNWELARQVGVALGSHDEPAVADLAGEQKTMETLSRAAEVACEEFTGLVAGTSASVEVVSRGRWVEENIAWFRGLLEPLARKMSTGGAPLPVPAADGMMQALRQVGAVVTGLQAGLVLGDLSRSVLGQYELTLPQPTGGRVLYVAPNLRQVEQDWGLDARDFRYWIALHEVTHHIELTRPWARSYFQSLVRTFIDSLDFDPSRMQGILGDLDILQNPERLSEALQNPEQLIQAAWTPLGRDTVNRIQAFMTLAEGYSTFVMDAVGAQVLKDHGRLQEVMRRRRVEASPGEVLLERMLGLELKRQQYEDGVKFCRYVAASRDIASLNRAWENPETLPTSEEFQNPEAWIERVLESELPGDS